MKTKTHLLFFGLVAATFVFSGAAAFAADVTIRWSGTILQTDIRFDGEFSFSVDDPNATTIIDLLTVDTDTNVVVSDGITSQTWSYVVPPAPLDVLNFRYCPGGEAQCGIPAPGSFAAALLPSWSGTPLATDCGAFTPVPCLVNSVQIRGEDPPVGLAFTDVGLAVVNFTFEIVPTPPMPEPVVEYRYEGNFFDLFSCGGPSLCSTVDPAFTSYTTSDFVRVSLVLDEPLAGNLLLQDVTAHPGFGLTTNDGQQELTIASEVLISTDTDGNIIGPWSVIANCCLFPNNGIASLNWPGGRGVGDSGALSAPNGTFPDTPLDFAKVSSGPGPGTWTRFFNEAPTANAGDDQSVRVGDTVVLQGTAFDDNTAEEDLIFVWDFTTVPDGSTATLIAGNTATPNFTVDAQGLFEITLLVTDADGAVSNPDSVIISSDNLAPSADAGDNQVVLVGSIVSLDGSGSSDPESDPLIYAWLLSGPAGSSASLSALDAVSPTFIPDQAGVYQATLSVSDFIGLGTADTVDITASTAEQFAEMEIVTASSVVAELGAGDVTTIGNKTALLNFFSQAIVAIQEGDLGEAISKIEKAIDRSNGCVLRGRPDGNGRGRDWITDCEEQRSVYATLVSALNALLE